MTLALLRRAALLSAASLLLCAALHVSASAACRASNGEMPRLEPIQSVSLTYDGATAQRGLRVNVIIPAGTTPPCALRMLVTEPPAWSLINDVDASSTLRFELSGPVMQSFLINGAPGGVFPFDNDIIIERNQASIPGGNYSRLLNISLVDWTSNGAGEVYDTRTFEVAALVLARCTLPSPSLSTIDLSGAISNGNVDPTMIFTANFVGAGCNDPGRLVLRGGPLLRSSGAASIDYRATSTLGTTQLTLDTRDASTVSAVIDPTPATTMSLAIGLMRNSSPLQPGTYSSVLTVTLEPQQ